ncbi:MAG: SDR family oxidoreductase [Burkholderiaceae bacterium]|nr:SDR family oxidoreductase [Burkholderiaceae bacterium]
MGTGTLQGKTAIITGAARGIGAATAMRLCEQGATLALNDIDADALETLMRRLPGSSHLSVPGDISSYETARKLAAAALQRAGRIDILINNAAILHCRDITETPEDEFDRVVDANVRSAYLCCRAVIPAMVAAQQGVIVNVGSISGMAGMEFDGKSTWLYSLTKAALLQLTRSLASRYGRDGLRINAVAPGPTRTSQLRGLVPGITAEQENMMWRSTGAEKTLLGRVGEPDEIANVVFFLAGPESGFMTGSVVVADGGYLVR